MVLSLSTAEIVVLPQHHTHSYKKTCGFMRTVSGPAGRRDVLLFFCYVLGPHFKATSACYLH